MITEQRLSDQFSHEGNSESSFSTGPCLTQLTILLTSTCRRVYLLGCYQCWTSQEDVATRVETAVCDPCALVVWWGRQRPRVLSSCSRARTVIHMLREQNLLWREAIFIILLVVTVIFLVYCKAKGVTQEEDVRVMNVYAPIASH